MELHSRPMFIMELHHVDDGSPQIVWSSITANYGAPWIELWVMDLHKSNDMELHNSNHESPFINPIMEAHNSITEIHKSSMEIHDELWRSMINHRAPWLCFSLLALRTQDSGQVYSIQNYTWIYYIRITLQNSTSMLNKYGPDIIENAEMHVGRPLLRHAILQPVLTITMNKMRKNETQLMNEQKMDM